MNYSLIWLTILMLGFGQMFFCCLVFLLNKRIDRLESAISGLILLRLKSIKEGLREKLVANLGEDLVSSIEKKLEEEVSNERESKV